MSEQKRDDPRFQAEPPIHVSLDLPSGEHVTHVVDLSAGGVQLHLNGPVDIGVRLRLELKLSPVSGSIETLGVVRWCNTSETGCRVGVEFESISNEDRKALYEALVWHSTHALKDSECVVLPLREKVEEPDREETRYEYHSEDGEGVMFPAPPEDIECPPAVETANVRDIQQAVPARSDSVVIRGLDGEEVELKVSKAVFWRR